MAPYSSLVLSLSVLIFQLLTSFRPRKRPMAMVVFPTSNAKSIACLLRHARRAPGRRRGRPCPAPPSRSTTSRPSASSPRYSAVNVPPAVSTRHGRAGRKSRPGLERPDDRLLVSPGEDIIPAVEGPAKGVEEGVDRHGAAAGDPDARSRPPGGSVGKIVRPVADVDADPDDGEVPARRPADGLRTGCRRASSRRGRRRSAT